MKRFIAFILFFLIVRLIWARFVPLGNDEAYYWDWGRQLQLSYVDHPPGVSYLAAFSQTFFSGPLGARFIIPFIHLLASYWLALTMKELKRAPLSQEEWWKIGCLTQLVPAFSLGGFFLLPDAGLMAGLAGTAYLTVKYAQQKSSITMIQALSLGLIMGVAGLFKYHALLTAGGLFVGLICLRRNSFKAESLKWLFVVITGALVTAPVWIWNVHHDLASLRFQSTHGFGDLTFNMSTALRFYMSQIIFLSPMIVIGLLRSAKISFKNNSWLNEPQTCLKLGFWPLFLLLGTLSFGKELLPHWVLPAYWLLTPIMALQPWTPSKAWRWNWLYAGAFIFAIPTFLSIPAARQVLLTSMNNRPGPLAELTLWHTLKEPIQRELDQLEVRSKGSSPALNSHCPDKVMLASWRWYWVAHLAFEFAQRDKVYSVDIQHPSYYQQRDRLTDYDGCQILVIADKRHLDPVIMQDLMQIEKEQTIVVPDHLDVPIVMLSGYLTTAKAAKKYPLLLGL